jgi:hypothetical protein
VLEEKIHDLETPPNELAKRKLNSMRSSIVDIASPNANLTYNPPIIEEEEEKTPNVKEEKTPNIKDKDVTPKSVDHREVA